MVGCPVKRTPIKPRSKKRASEQTARRTLCAAVLDAYAGRCALSHLGGCNGPTGRPWTHGDGLEFHEVIRRSQLAGSHLNPFLVIPLCRGHHNMDSNLSEAQTLGLRAPRWAYDQYGQDAVIAELARLRQTPGQPFWASE
jgi:hypothetical protein